MSKRILSFLMLVSVPLALAAQGPVAGTVSTPNEASVLLRRAEVVAASADSLRREIAARRARLTSNPVGQLQAGGWTIAYRSAIRPEVLDSVRVGLELGRKELDRRAGALAVQLVDTGTLTLRPNFDPRTPGLIYSYTLGTWKSASSYMTTSSNYVRAPVTSNDLVEIARERAGNRLAQLLGNNMKLWLSLEVPLDTTTGQSWHFTQRDLALSTSGPAQRCLGGVIGECARVLGSVQRAVEWYDYADLRKLIGFRVIDGRTPPEVATRRRACLAGNDRACVEEALIDGKLTPPVTVTSRWSLTQLALGIGGDSAIGRLVSSDSTLEPVARLAIAAGIPERDLLTRWQGKVKAAQAEGLQHPVKSSIAVAGWSALLALAAARRKP